MKAIAAETFVHNYVVEYSFIKASRSLILLSICIGSFLWWSVFSKTSITAIYMFGYNGIYICIYIYNIYTDLYMRTYMYVYCFSFNYTLSAFWSFWDVILGASGTFSGFGSELVFFSLDLIWRRQIQYRKCFMGSARNEDLISNLWLSNAGKHGG